MATVLQPVGTTNAPAMAPCLFAGVVSNVWREAQPGRKIWIETASAGV
jgi:hypothetical protein